MFVLDDYVRKAGSRTDDFLFLCDAPGILSLVAAAELCL